MRTRAVVTAVVIAAVVALVAAAGGGDDTASPPASTDDPARVPATTTEPPGIAPTIGSPTSPSTEPPVTSGPASAEVGVELPTELQLVTGGWRTDWTKRTIELDELLVGIFTSDPRDVIRPLDGPAYETVEEASAWLENRELGILFEFDEVARFYPLRIITSHEVVNDEINGFPYVVTYCPLCNTAVAFPREVDGEVRFGVSGLLRNSDLVMWDDATDSLWQQTSGEGIVGAFAGTQLDFLPTALVRWEDFTGSHPDGEVLSIETGLPFNYAANAYVGYTSRSAPYSNFFNDEVDGRFPALERVVGVRVGEVAKAYPYSVIAVERVANDAVDGVPITVWWGAADTSDPLDKETVAGGAAIGTGIACLPMVDGQVLNFSAIDDAIFGDEETGSLWNILGEAISGPLIGSELELALHQNEFWFAWSAFNPGRPVYGG